MILYVARDIPPFVMYCVHGESGSSLLIESTDSMIIHNYWNCNNQDTMPELIPPGGARRREKVGALYSVVSYLLAGFSRGYSRFLSPSPHNIYQYHDTFISPSIIEQLTQMHHETQ